MSVEVVARPSIGTPLASGIGSGVVLAWAWAGYMVPLGNPPMPNEVAVTVVTGVIGLVHWLVNRRSGVVVAAAPAPAPAYAPAYAPAPADPPTTGELS